MVAVEFVNPAPIDLSGLGNWPAVLTWRYITFLAAKISNRFYDEIGSLQCEWQ